MEMTMEYMGGLKFPAQKYDLTTIPDNERAAKDAAAMMPWVRMAALFLCQSDEQLEASVRATADEEGMNEWVHILEAIGATLDARRQDADMLEAGFTRLLVVIERIVGKAEIERSYREPSDNIFNSAEIRSRLRYREGWRPRLAISKDHPGCVAEVRS